MLELIEKEKPELVFGKFDIDEGKGKSVKEQALHELIERARLVEIMMLASIPT